MENLKVTFRGAGVYIDIVLGYGHIFSAAGLSLHASIRQLMLDNDTNFRYNYEIVPNSFPAQLQKPSGQYSFG